MKIPELKQFGELTAEDFERHPVWIGCHTADYGKPWYDDTDEETFRPYTGRLPANPSEGMLLVRAVIQLHDGSLHSGFLTPASPEWDKRPDGRPTFQDPQILSTQQPQILAGDRQFGFWGGRTGVPTHIQQELYSALRKSPDAIFPLRFRALPGLASGFVEGQVDGFYQRDGDGIRVGFADREQIDSGSMGAGWFSVWARSNSGYPQPERGFGYLKIVYRGICLRCGVFDRQVAPFRFKKPGSRSRSGFTQLNWVTDAFFAPPAIVEELMKEGIKGLSVCPAIYHRTGEECADRVQLMIPTVIACAETSQLPTVTCCPENEEVVALRAAFANHNTLSGGQKALSPELQEKIRKGRERNAAIPYCGRVKYHVPTSLALMPDALKDAPDLFQTAEWFGSGGQAFRLTLASERFVKLVEERRWRGLVFHNTRQSGLSERVQT